MNFVDYRYFFKCTLVLDWKISTRPRPIRYGYKAFDPFSQNANVINGRPQIITI